MGPRIYNVARIGSGVLAVMAKPVAGEWIDEEFSSIETLDIKQVVSLLESSEAYELGLEKEGQLCEKHGMAFVSFAIPDRGLPASVADFSTVTRRLYEEILEGRNTVVHCRAGIGRTGIFAAGILLHDGIAPTEAFEMISQARRVPVPDTDEQRDWVVNNRQRICANTWPGQGRPTRIF